jgi:hypothetical protein
MSLSELDRPVLVRISDLCTPPGLAARLITTVIRDLAAKYAAGAGESCWRRERAAIHGDRVSFCHDFANKLARLLSL